MKRKTSKTQPRQIRISTATLKKLKGVNIAELTAQLLEKYATGGSVCPTCGKRKG